MGAIYLTTGHPVTATLAAGQYTVFGGCTQEMTSCAHLTPDSVTIRAAGHPVLVVPDPSSDHDTEAEPFVGLLSFRLPRAGTAALELATAPGQPVFVVPSEGQLVRGLIGLIAVTAAAVIILLGSLLGLGRLAWWRLEWSRLTPRPGPGQVQGDRP